MIKATQTTMRSIPLPAYNFSLPAIDCQTVERSPDVPQEPLSRLDDSVRQALAGKPAALMELAAWCNTGAVFVSDSGQPNYTVIPLSQETKVCLYRAAASLGDAEASFQLGSALEQGTGVSADIPGAMMAYRQGANAGHQTAAYNLAALQLNGNNEPERSAAVSTLEQLALSGLKAAMLSYGAIHLPDFGPDWTAPSYESAIRWIDAAGDEGPAETQYWLAIFFNSGTANVAKDPERATRLFQASAQQGFPLAEHIMGVLCLKTSPQSAIAWFENAAGKGVADSQVNLAIFYGRGEQVPRDPKRAYWWARLAESQGEKVASLVEEIKSQLSDEEVVDLEKRVQGFLRVVN